MNEYLVTIKKAEYKIKIEKHKQLIYIYVNNNQVFEIDFLDRESNDELYFYTINIKNEPVVISIEYYIPKDSIKVAFKTNCYYNDISLIDGTRIDFRKTVLLDKTRKGFKTYCIKNGFSIIKETMLEMVSGSILGWGFVLFGIKKQLLVIVIMPFVSFLVGLILIFTSYFHDKRLIKNWNKQYISSITFE